MRGKIPSIALGLVFIGVACYVVFRALGYLVALFKGLF